MVSRIYFALVSGISARTLLPRYSKALLEGDWQNAYAAVAAVADSNERQLNDGDDRRLLALADSLALRDLDEEAEQYYARAQRACSGVDDEIRMLSCRNAGWQALKRDRFGLARNCFTRIVRDEAASPEQATEACIGLAIVDHQLGQQSAAEQALEYARRFVANVADPLWGKVVDLLAADLRVQIGVRCAGALADHVFWQSARLNGAQRPATEEVHPAPLPSAAAAAVLPLLMRRHVAYLHCLVDTSVGSDDAATQLSRVLEDVRLCGSATLLPQMRVGALLAALGGGFSTLAERLLDAIGKRDIGNGAMHSNLDWLYASAKVAALRGQMLNALTLYTRYSREALHCLRSEVLMMRTLDPRSEAGAQGRSDDVVGRLPAKYRRAYRYIIDNIAQSALTTREVAAYINVTERALQMVFKRSLGMSPGALIRQLRLDGIRGELLDESRPSTSVLDTANRWGVTSRSALIKSYRKQFNESPSETMNG
ncbi:helix-turn-helix transcriptional regulator [Robbsia sp. Bb-Pol-6]|uniref:Helix-turn-helix transcriptional regulator n=1 Tax=Robbsia betulipollinis TaxID=2981849 RepID=A0ABT3ZKL4_9BURK|nr:helix-turn-helix transcriptional regulator [Robbsia betulipollinis]MCY0387074.1 helix-turn-helix transcriptional regulator [Robbsia betulipollinis]